MSESDLAELLVATGRAHHEAFLATDGADPEWPIWYAEYLEPILRESGYQGTRAELIAELVNTDRAHRAEGAEVPWPPFYASRLLPTLS